MAAEIVEGVTGGTMLCLQLSSFAPSYIVFRIVVFVIGKGLTVFDTYTDWVVVKSFESQGFNYPLLPRDDNWLRAWYLFATIGTILTCISFFHDGLDIVHSIFQSCKINICKSCWKAKKKTIETHNQDLTIRLLENVDNIEIQGRDQEAIVDEERQKVTINEVTSEVDEENEKVERITDACTCCYRFGWNFGTRNETIAIIILWFQALPMLTLSILFAITQITCIYPSSEDLNTVLLHISISATAAILASTFRLVRSYYRLTISICLRAKEKNYFGVKKILPKNEDVTIYPPGKCSQFCLIPFYIAMMLQGAIITVGSFTTFILWLFYILLVLGSISKANLAIYRTDINYGYVHEYSHLFNISGTLFPPKLNNTRYTFNESILDSDYNEVFCQSEFVYREANFQIYYNTIEYSVIDENGKFCANYSTEDCINNTCRLFYPIQTELFIFKVFYGFPSNGEINRLNKECSVLNNGINSLAGPEIDLSIQLEVDNSTTRLPHGNRSELVIFYPDPINTYIPVSQIYKSIFIGYVDAIIINNVTCVVFFKYVRYFRQIVYDYCDYEDYSTSSRCCCDRFPKTSKCEKIHENIVYGSLDLDLQKVTPYTSCSFIPENKLVPIFQDSLLPNCICG